MQNISSAQTLRDLTTFDIYVHPTGSGPLLIYFWKGLNVIFLTGLPLQDWISKYRHQMMIGPQCKFAEACFKCFKRLKISGILSMTLHKSQHTSRSWYVQNYVFGFDTNLIILKPIDSVLTLWKSENSQLWFVAHRRPLELLSSTFRSRERGGAATKVVTSGHQIMINCLKSSRGKPFGKPSS